MQTNQKPGQLIVERINKTRRQIRVVELVTLAVMLLACLIVFLLISVLIDHWCFKNGTPTVLRYLGLFVIGGGGIAYFIWRLIPLASLAVNPAYAAEVLEKSHPGMKNRLVNWVFLRRVKRDKSSPSTQTERLVIDSVGRETAANLNAIPDHLVVDCTAMIRWGIVLAVVLGLFCLYIVVSPKNALQSVARAATPFFDIEPPQSIVIKEVEPGDVTARQGETIQVKARLDRTTNKPVYLAYSTDDGRLIDQRMPMQGSEDGMRFECRFPPGKRGFEESLTYRVEVGDARSKSYAVTVKPSIAVDVKSVEYRYPDYTKLPARTVENSGDLRAVEGTQVTVTVESNVAMSRAVLQPDGDAARAIRLNLSPSKTEAKGVLTLGFEPEQPAKPFCASYTLRCWDDEQRTNPLPNVYRVETVRDEAPTVEWADDMSENEPMQVALNEPFDVIVEARDPDFGLQRLRLRGSISRTVDSGVQREGSTLPETNELPFEDVELLQNPPRTGTVTIKKTLVPSKLGLRAGDRVSYFAEAVDTKEPDANTAATSPRVFVVTDVDPDMPLDPPVNDEPQEQNDQGRGEAEQRQNQGDGQNQSGDDSGDDSENSEQSEDGGDQTGNQRQSQNGNESGDEPPQDQGNEPGHERDDQRNLGNDERQNQQRQETRRQQADDQQADENRQQPGERGQDQDTSNTGDADGSAGDSEQRNQGGGQPSDEAGDGSDQQGTGGEQQPDDQRGNPSDRGNQENQDGDSQDRQPQSGNQADSRDQQGQQNRQGPQQDQSNGNRSQNGRPNAGNPDRPIDGNSNPGDVFDKVREHMREKGIADEPNSGERGNENGNRTENQTDDVRENGALQNRGLQNGRNERNDNNTLSDQPPESAPEQTPEHDDGRTSDRTDGYETRDGHDPNAEQLDPNADKPIYGGQNDTGQDATEADEPGRKMTDDQSQAELPRGDNARAVDPDDAENGGANAARSQTGDTPDKASDGTSSDQRDQRQGDRTNQSSDDRRNGQASGVRQQQPTEENDASHAERPDASQGNENAGHAPSQHRENTRRSDDGNNPEAEGGGRSQRQDRGSMPDDLHEPSPVPDEANLDYTRQATDLAIRYLEDELGKERPDQQLLDRLGGWDQNDLRRFVDRWKEMRQQAQDSPETNAGRKFEETLRNVGNLTPKATIGTQRNDRRQTQTTTLESQRYAPPKGKYEELMKAYTEGIGK